MAKLIKIESTSQMAFTPKSGYVTSAIGYDAEGKLTELIKKSDGTITQIGGGGGSADGYVVVEEDGILKAQKLSFNGTEASFDGTAETLDATKVGLFATTQDEPAYKGSGGGGAFYKCSSVDTTAKTWSGYLAVLGEDGAYSFEETVTEGLSYGVGFTPAVDGIFNSDCTVKVSGLYLGFIIPEEGLLFYAPFTKASLTASTGQDMSTVGNPQYTTIQGIKCMQLDMSSRIDTTLSWDLGTSDFAVSVMAYLGDNTGVLFSCGGFRLAALMDQGLWETTIAGDTVGRATAAGCNANQWHHVVFMRSNGIAKLYINGNEVVSVDGNYDMNWGTFSWGCWTSDSIYFDGALSAARIYTRALTEEEIQTLAFEFTPTA